MKLNLEELKNTVDVLTEKEKNYIKGGDDIVNNRQEFQTMFENED